MMDEKYRGDTCCRDNNGLHLHSTENGNQFGEVTQDACKSSPCSTSGNVEQFIEDQESPAVMAVTHRRHLHSKLLFVISVASLILIAYMLVVVQWLLPYYYAISTPLLIGLRVYLYVKLKWQYFLIDFCYFGNTALYIYIWAAPQQANYFAVMFGLANGPLAWATYIFRNSLAFHDLDKVTSVYIHVLPLFLTYVIRWFPEQVSTHWYTSFVSSFNVDPLYMFSWVVGAAFACFVLHTIIYVILVYVICRPDSSYLNSFRYLVSKDSIYSTVVNACGPKYRFVIYVICNFVYCILSLVLSMLFYHSIIAHSIYVCVIFFIVTWNGASFYVDVFSQKGFRNDV